MRIEGDSSENYGATCGKMNENGLFYALHSNETLAQYGEFPWVVFIATINKTSGAATFVCGGALIHPLYVLTTAHNVVGKSQLHARFGEWDIGTDKELFPHQEITVDEIIIHPGYSLSPIKNDIALLALKTRVLYQVHIQPICLPQETDEFDGERCISNGWGSVEGSYARIMKKISLPVIPRARCQRMIQFAGLGPHYRLPEGFICAGGEADVDTCKGDGGSPLACRQPDDSFVLAGLVSWGIGCGGHYRPGAYVAVNKYVSWINSNIYPEHTLADIYWCVLFVLYSLVCAATSDNIYDEPLKKCEGGYCLPKFVCQNGVYNKNNSPDITLRLASDDDDECIDLMLVCCRNDTEIVGNSECSDGHCVAKELCPNGIYDETKAQEHEFIQLKLGGCTDTQTCCKTAPQFPLQPVGLLSFLQSNEHQIHIITFFLQSQVSRKVENSECGKSNPNGLVYRFEGNRSYAQYGEFPWMVVIMATNSDLSLKKIVGGGSLIHPKFVVSAAHIFKAGEEYLARFGEWDLQGTNKSNEPYPVQDIKIERNITHPAYIKLGLRNDIALVKLVEEVTFQHHIRPICLPKPDDVFDGQRCISTGWGVDAHTSKFANVLKRIDLPVIPRETCLQMFRATRLSIFFELHESVLCAGAEEGVDMCDGDGGGPLACVKEDGTYALAGIVSWGLGCHENGVPGAYVNVAKFSNWITQTLRDAN
ncbi:phenoloxidase-activating enzyme-like [Anopheles coustani]|uniref:phenoloxidase-activating enzyme-like n=1 Tax=Anopheles coustani TaxID=139045 RepID=UPI00265B1A2F|nr:phenoloxidase-activating enzyme-like [Anopheles coustani]